MKKNCASSTKNVLSECNFPVQYRLYLVFPLTVLFLVGCAGFGSKVRSSRTAFENGDYTAAAAQLDKLLEKKDNDELAYLMELGLVYHTAGKYKEAIATFARADKLAEIRDYTSLTKEAASLLLSDEAKPYKGEDFEKILINVYLAIDYALLGQEESALVECRRVNHKLDLMITEGKLPYDRNAFAKYLAGALFESGGEINSALVDYRQLASWRGPMPYLGEPLLRLTQKLGMDQELEEYKKKFSGVSDYKLSKKEGEVILVLEQGKAPYKVPREGFRLLPRFQRSASVNQAAYLRSDGGEKAKSEPFFDIEATAEKELEHRVGLILAKKIGGLVVKEAAAAAVAKTTKSELAGAITRLVLYAQDQADLRSWTFLPARLQLARLKLPVGKHTLYLDTVQTYGGTVTGYRKWEGVEVKPGKITFINARVL
jgi:uncharacterized protein